MLRLRKSPILNDIFEYRSSSLQIQQLWIVGDSGSQHDSGQDQDAIDKDEDDLQTVKELLRRALRKEDSRKEPKDGDCQGKCINSSLQQTEQLLIKYGETSCS